MESLISVIRKENKATFFFIKMTILQTVWIIFIIRKYLFAIWDWYFLGKKWASQNTPEEVHKILNGISYFSYIGKCHSLIVPRGRMSTMQFSLIVMNSLLGLNTDGKQMFTVGESS